MKTKNSIVALLTCFLFVMTLPFSALAETVPEEDPFAVALNPARDYLIIVDNEHPYEFGGDYDQLLLPDVINDPDVDGVATPIEKAASLAFGQLQVALWKKGMTVGLLSAYRTYEDQDWVYNYYSKIDGWEHTPKAGYSEHHTGLLLNVMILYPGDDGEEIWYTETAERQKTIPFFKLLHETLADFGFIDRYPAGKEDITGMPCLPYLIRFVGSSEVAHAIMDNGLCLEEYVAANTEK
ncbi:D-alanyl-D-alanine carboxypeptidase family protein [Candidatus Saccharibacteria bacterium]|nr:D-alanyl-D-alanine carboxypeptidase family protein [Candidatus Saccharibacteria bacterium]